MIEKLASKLGYSIEDTEHWLECDSCGTDWDGSYLCPDAPSNAAYREAHKDDPPSATAQMMQGIYGPIIKRQLESLSLFKEMFHG